MEWASATWQLRYAFLLLFLLRPAAAQFFSSSPPPPNLMPFSGPQFNPAMAAIVIALISLFLVMAFFSIYFRSRRALQELERAPAAGPTRVNAASRGLDPAVVESFPKFVYSEVKQHKIGKGALECAVCLSEFEDDDTLRLLPKCDHVFHPDCIDSWFASHTTCPVCRTNLAETAVAAPPEAVVITVAEGEVTVPSPPPPAAATAVVEDEEELPPLPPGRQRRKIPRSHSTGHSLAEDRERYTLRLPETIRRDVVTRGFTRSTSCYTGGGESSTRKGRGDIGGGGRSSFKTRTWERWASFKRSFSARGSRGEDAGGSGGTGAVGRSLSKKKEVRYAEEGPVNIPV